MSTPILFVDRDGTLIEEPGDFQVDAYEKLRFVEGVIPAMLKLRDAGYEFVIVSNQDGLGSDAYPQAAFDGPHALMMQVFESQGIRFREVLVDTSLPDDNLPTRKPGIGLALHYLRDRGIDLERSAMVGDRDTDLEFAANLHGADAAQFDARSRLGVNALKGIGRDVAVNGRFFFQRTGFPFGAAFGFGIVVMKNAGVVFVATVGVEIKIQHYALALALNIVVTHLVVGVEVGFAPAAGFIIEGDDATCLIAESHGYAQFTTWHLETVGGYKSQFGIGAVFT